MKTKIIFSNKAFWSCKVLDEKTLWIKGCPEGKNIIKLISEISNLKSEKEITYYLENLRGNFTFVYKDFKKTILVSDRIRSTPIYYSVSNNTILISNDFNKINPEIDFVNDSRNDALLELKMGGFTIGDKTIIKDIFSTLAGQCILIINKKITKKFYSKYFNKIDKNSNKNELIDELSEVTKQIFYKTIENIGDKQVLIPLSAGNDSRLVASLFKELGVKNVLCFSYGRKNNFEARFAKEIAHKLGYKWIFLANDNRDEREFYKSKLFQDYLNFSDSLSSVSYFQGLSTNYRLKKQNLIKEDAIFVNGNSGDFITGGHIKSIDFNKNSKNLYDYNSLIECYIGKHFSLWGKMNSHKNMKTLKDSVIFFLDKVNMKLNDDNYHLHYEFLELIDRQSKYVVSGQMTYEFFNHKWELPLWSDEYLFFWSKIPKEYKLNQTLYTEMLKKLNWGGVWKNIPVNKKNISPKYFIPLRMILKIPFSFFGKKGVNSWHDFETVFLKYWMDPVNYYSFKSYFEILKMYNNKPKNAVSWVVNDYFKSKKLN